MKTQQQTSIRFQLTALRVLGFRYMEPATEIAPETVDMKLAYRIVVQSEPHTVAVDISMTVEHSRTAPAELGSLQLRLLFDVPDLDSFPRSKGRVGFAGSLTGLWLDIAFSTLRGVWFAKTQGTSLERLVLPVMNPTFFTEMIQAQRPAEHPAKTRKK